MSTSDRKPYLTSMVLDQDFLDKAHDNMTNQLELVVEIDAPGGKIYASDRNKYVGDIFYEALLQFPTIKRTIGEWLSPVLEFSTINIELSNVDGRFNDILPGGANFQGWIQRQVVIKLGLRDVAATYTPIFRGRVTEVGGFSRTTKSIRITARDEFEKLNEKFPIDTLDLTEFIDLEEKEIGKIKPIIYGDWTVAVNPDTGASIPAIPVNGANAGVLAGTTNLSLYISANNNVSFDNTSVVLVRGGEAYSFNSADVTNIGAGNNTFDLKQSGTGGVTLINGTAFTYKSGDKIFCKVKGKDLGAYDDNIVEIARDILLTYTDFVAGDFDTSWNTYRDKNTPAQSAISTFKARVYRDKAEKAVTFALSLLEQVRLEGFVGRDLKLKLNSLHFEDFPTPTYQVNNWDIEKDSFRPEVDARNNINRMQGLYNFLPDIGDTFNLTSYFRNQDSIDILSNGKIIEKGVTFPNLYERTTVNYQLIEILKMASSFFEAIPCTLTWRSLLLELGDFVSMNVQIGSSEFDNVPCMVRQISYNPNGIKLPVRLWSFQMTPYPGYTPGYANTVGGYNATITEE